MVSVGFGDVPSVTVIVSVFSPTPQLAFEPLVTSVVPFLIDTVAVLSAAVAVTLLEALVVVQAYSVTSGSNSGVSSSVPIVSAERDASKGLRSPDGRRSSGGSADRPRR